MMQSVALKRLNREDTWNFLALDPAFDDVVVAMAKRVLPEGFDVSDVAPETYEELCAHMATGQRLVVASHASELTIYGSKEVNWSFRAWHDWTHWTYKLPFTFVGEAETVWLQAEAMTEVFSHDRQCNKWRMYLFGEVLGQALHLEKHKAFPENQRLFMKKFLEAFESMC